MKLICIEVVCIVVVFFSFKKCVVVGVCGFICCYGNIIVVCSVVVCNSVLDGCVYD